MGIRGRACTGNERDPRRSRAVARADEVAAGRAGRTDQTLELKTRDDVVVVLVAPLELLLDGEYVVSQREDDGTDLDGHELVLCLEVDCLLIAACLDAEAALDTGVEVDGVDQRGDLRVVDVDCLSRRHAEFERVRLDDRADFRTVAAAGAAAADDAADFRLCRGDDPACLLSEGHVEVADVSLNSLDLGIGEEFDPLVPVDIHHLRGKDALRAVQCREGLVELGHPAADGGALLHEVGLDACIRKVECCLHAADTAADDHCRLLYGDALRDEVLKQGCLCYGDPDCVLCLGGGLFGLVHVHPRVLLADVCHLEPEGV
ncbi:hypothetical protein DSECCO2_552430 [anaerobic digester metagenome]